MSLLALTIVPRPQVRTSRAVEQTIDKQALKDAVSEMEAEMGHPPRQLWIPAPTVPQAAPDWDPPQARDVAGILMDNPPIIEPTDHVYMDGSCFNNGCPHTARA